MADDVMNEGYGYAAPRKRREEPSNPINTGSFGGGWVSNLIDKAKERVTNIVNENKQAAIDYANTWNNRTWSKPQEEMLFPTDWGGTTIGPEPESEPEPEPEQPIAPPKQVVVPQQAEEPMPDIIETTPSTRTETVQPEIVTPVSPQGRDSSAAFRRAIDRANRDEDETEFFQFNRDYLVDNPVAPRTPSYQDSIMANAPAPTTPQGNGYVSTAYLRENPGESQNDMLFPTDYGGTTIPGMPSVSAPVTPRPQVTREQFLEGASNFLNPLMNFGVPTATGESEYTPRPYNEDARRAVEVDRALRSLGTIPGNVQDYMNDNGLEPSWLLTPAGREMLNDMPNSPLNAGTVEPTAGVNSFTDASLRSGNNTNPLASAIGTAAENYALGNLALGISSPLAPILNIPGGSDIVANLAGNVLQNLGNDVGRYADVVRDYNNDLSDIPSQNPYETIIDYPTETPFEPAPPTPVVTPVDLSTTEQANNPVNNTSSTGTRYDPYANMSTYDEAADRLAREQYNRSTRSNTAYDNPFMSNSVLGNESFNIADPFAPAISQNDMKDIQDAFNSLPSTMTDWQKQELMWQAYNDPLNFKPDPGIVTGMEPPQLDENGVPNYTMTLLMNTKDYIADDGTQLRVGADGQYYKPGEDKPVAPDKVTAVPHYDADTVFQTFVDLPKTAAMKKGGQVAWKKPIQDLLNDPTLTQEERDGLNALLVSKFWAGTEERGREFYDRQFFDGTDAQYNHLAQLFVDKLGLNGLLSNGVMSVNDVVNFFFKAPKSGSESTKTSSPRSYQPYGYRGGYGRGGYSRGYGGGYGGYSGYGSSPSNANQRQNRVYNIMKNWSF